MDWHFEVEHLEFPKARGVKISMLPVVGNLESPNNSDILQFSTGFVCCKTNIRRIIIGHNSSVHLLEELICKEKISEHVVLQQLEVIV